MKRNQPVRDWSSRVKRSQPRRDWSRAIAKREDEGNVCRVCPSQLGVELAHISGRTFDYGEPLRSEGWKQLQVHPDRVLPLCKVHHLAYDAHRLDLLGWLTLNEQLQTVADLGGIELARIRVGSISRAERAAA